MTDAVGIMQPAAEAPGALGVMAPSTLAGTPEDAKGAVGVMVPSTLAEALQDADLCGLLCGGNEAMLRGAIGLMEPFVKEPGALGVMVPTTMAEGRLSSAKGTLPDLPGVEEPG